MGSGNYDHPSYIARQTLNLTTVAGAAGKIYRTFPWPIRIRTFIAGVQTAGTVVGTGVGAAGACVSLQNGTAIVSSTNVLSTSAAGVFGTTGDLNYTLPVGGTLAVVNGTDATLVATATIEYHIDPSATWLGNG